MDKKDTTLVVGLLFIVVNLSIILSYPYKVHAVGVIKAIGVGVYWDPECSNSITEIDWGVIGPGEDTSRLTYIRNEGNYPSILSISTSDWNPVEAATYITLSWNYTGGDLNPGEAVPVDLQLSVSQLISGIEQFSFLITISAEG